MKRIIMTMMVMMTMTKIKGAFSGYATLKAKTRRAARPWEDKEELDSYP